MHRNQCGIVAFVDKKSEDKWLCPIHEHRPRFFDMPNKTEKVEKEKEIAKVLLPLMSIGSESVNKQLPNVSETMKISRVYGELNPHTKDGNNRWLFTSIYLPYYRLI